MTGQTHVPPGDDFIAVAAGVFHGLGLKSDGSIATWGTDGSGQPVPSPNVGFVAVAAGDKHSLGLRSDGSIAAWGFNGHGQCAVPLPNAGFLAIGAGGHTSLAIKAPPLFLVGTEANDRIVGGLADDMLLGGGGDDVLEGGGGVDLIVAGSGDDVIIIRPGNVPLGKTEDLSCGSGTDVVLLIGFIIRDSTAATFPITDPWTRGTYTNTAGDCESIIISAP